LIPIGSYQIKSFDAEGQGIAWDAESIMTPHCFGEFGAS
jgi:hypothetical protein